VPLWVVEAYNPGRDLDRLVPGDRLALPVPADALIAGVLVDDLDVH
jgi:hypothetical protein